eukprot:scaffold44999_cov59-Phaeocystis_antarctica.AAC.1
MLGHRLGWARLRALGRLGARLLDGVRQPAKLGERQHEHGAEGAEHQHRLPPMRRIAVSSRLAHPGKQIPVPASRYLYRQADTDGIAPAQTCRQSVHATERMPPARSYASMISAASEAPAYPLMAPPLTACTAVARPLNWISTSARSHRGQQHRRACERVQRRAARRTAEARVHKVAWRQPPARPSQPVQPRVDHGHPHADAHTGGVAEQRPTGERLREHRAEEHRRCQPLAAREEVILHRGLASAALRDEAGGADGEAANHVEAEDDQAVGSDGKVDHWLPFLRLHLRLRLHLLLRLQAQGRGHATRLRPHGCSQRFGRRID